MYNRLRIVQRMGVVVYSRFMYHSDGSIHFFHFFFENRGIFIDRNNPVCIPYYMQTGNLGFSYLSCLVERILFPLQSFIFILKSATPFPKCYLHKEE